MKRFSFMLALLFALTANALGTDILVSGIQTTQIPFNPSNLGNTRTFTVTATSASATVTSAALFPTTIVGKSGFTISIGGVFYTVAAVASTSSLTLTRAFTGSTGSTTLSLYPYTLLRAFPTAGFQSSTVTSTTATIAVTNGSATVTSAALFPTRYTGVAGGYQVLIDGNPYQVLWQASTSSLVLTQTYAGSTGAATMTFDGVAENLQPSAPGGQWYKEVAVSVVNLGSGNVLYYPSFVMPATTNATVNNQARYVFVFYRPDNSQLAIYQCGAQSQLAIPTTTPTTWTAICNYNSPGGVVPPNTEVYTKSQIDQRFPSCTSGQSYYFAANGNIVSCLNFGTGLTLTGNTLTAPSASAVTDYRGAINISKAPYECDNTYATSAQTCLQTAITAAAATTAKELYIPPGTYKVSSLILPDELRIVGDGKDKTIIKSDGTNAPVLYCQTSCSHLKLRDLTVEGTSAGAAQDGIQITGASVAGVHLDTIVIKNTGGRGLWINTPTDNLFSSLFENIDVSEWNRANATQVPAIDVDTHGPSVILRNIYAHATASTSVVGFRFRKGATRTLLCENCNGIDPSGSGSVWAIVGQDTAYGDAATNVSFVTFLNSNIEAFTATGVEVRGTGSVVTFLGANNFTAGANSVRPIWYRTATNPYSSPGTFDPATIMANGDTAAVTYANSQAVHSNGLPPLILTGPPGTFGAYAGPIQYYDTSTSTTEPIRRLDAWSIVSPTDDYDVQSEGVKVINSVSNGTARTITLLWAGRMRPGEVVVVADATGDARTNPITIDAAIGTIDGIGSQTIYNNYGAIAFYPVGDNWKSFGQSKTPGLDWDNGNQAVTGFARWWAGTAGSDGFPAFALSTDSDTGISFPAANQLAFSLGGQRRLQLGNQVSIYAYGASAGNTGSLLLYNLAATGSVTLRAHDTSAAYSLTFPSNVPAGTECLQMSSTGAVTTTGSACGGGGGAGTVTSFSAGNLSPLFTSSVATATTTPALTFSLSNAAANTYFGNATGSSAAPSFTTAAALTKTDDTNVTLTLGGAPTTSLLTATSLTLGWTGSLAVGRGGTGITSGTSGGIPYFSSTSTIASSLSLTANLPVIGGGAGVAPTVGTRSGNTTSFATTTGTLTSGRCAEWDANGNIVQSSGACGIAGAGYTTIQEEGSSLTARVTMNFVGSSATAADDAGNTRTNITFDSDLNALASNSTNGFWAAGTNIARTLTGTSNVITITDGDGVAGNPTFTVGSLVVRTDQANTYSTGAQSFSAATSLTLPVAAGAAPTANGTIAFDSTANDLEYGDNGTNRKIANLDEVQTFTNKTLTLPSISDYSNANHNHQGASGGGILTTASLSGLGTGVATALAVNVGSAGAFVTFNGAGGTPSTLALANATGLPPTTGISGWPANASGCLANNGAGTLTWGNCGVTSVTATNATLTISPTTGAVLAGLNLANANTWTALQTVAIEDAGLSTTTNIADLQHSSNTTPITTGFGAGIRFGLESTTTLNQQAGLVKAVWGTATHASRQSYVSISGQSVATTSEVARFQGVGSSVNYWDFYPSATGQTLEAAAAGTDTDIGINLGPKGAGVVTINTVPILTETNTATVTNKTIADSSNALGSVTMDVTGTDATGDVYYRNSGGVLTRLAIGSSTQVLTVSGGLPSWATPGSGISTIGTIDTQTKSANGAVISGTSLVMQTADATSVGLVSITAQTLAGAKTFSGAFISGAGFRTLRTATATNYTITAAADHIVGVTSTAAARTITLPDTATAGAGAEYTIVDESGAASVNNITIVPAGSNTFIGGVTSLLLDVSGGSVTVYSNGGSGAAGIWFIK